MDEHETPFLTGKSGATWFFNLLGGTKRRGRWTMPQYSLIGGVHIERT